MIKILIYVILGLFIISSYGTLICLILVSKNKFNYKKVFYFLFILSIILLIIFGILRNI